MKQKYFAHGAVKGWLLEEDVPAQLCLRKASLTLSAAEIFFRAQYCLRCSISVKWKPAWWRFVFLKIGEHLVSRPVHPFGGVRGEKARRHADVCWEEGGLRGFRIIQECSEASSR